MLSSSFQSWPQYPLGQWKGLDSPFSKGPPKVKVILLGRAVNLQDWYLSGQDYSRKYFLEGVAKDYDPNLWRFWLCLTDQLYGLM